ncbi:pimeloyl-ACP methyl ester carboxylesterase [Symbiobacterium terraclitae]|uniref:Pimeloyl-ACP methyl ester carboxylesterase n=1 Tax=Symbiobacterium terraclitae TaxID=557451 RepID=A0ABS4JPS4_9FIRM|nr:hypothetical protein [Symbiobacterium terraclitae]MBP2017544.1 pimeloyl-ACP methyl ester carboxylesterase [Symbiobacterium terraclitae]
MRRIVPLFLVCSLMLASASVSPVQAARPPEGAAAAAAAAPPAPTRVGMTLGAGDWYVGATPPNVDPAKPVLVFVHGKGGSASVWWDETTYHGTNDMYAYAYNNGYRTAFVSLHPEGTMWANGQLLSSLLNSITSYFGVNRVTIVAHSKGGVDANAASVHYGAAPKIREVITLGTPHRGTPVADLAYSDWAGWLAELLGQRTDAAYVMQTGYMDYFRSVTDGLDPAVRYSTVSGYKCGPVFTALWLGCMYISGEDDGLVPVWSAEKPGGTHLRTGYWDHDEIRMGSRVWSTIAPRLTAAGSPGERAVAAPQPYGGEAAPGNLILRGGPVSGGSAAASFPVERGVTAVTFHVLGSSADLSASLVAPDGTVHPVKLTGRIDEGEVLAGAWIGSAEVQRPQAGEWRLEVTGAKESAYLMVAALEGGVQAVLDRGAGVSLPGESRPVTLRLLGPAVAESRAEARLVRDGAAALGHAEFRSEGGRHVALVEAPEEAGVHALSVTVTGTLRDGSAFERNLVTSFAVFDAGP